MGGGGDKEKKVQSVAFYLRRTEPCDLRAQWRRCCKDMVTRKAVGKK